MPAPHLPPLPEIRLGQEHLDGAVHLLVVIGFAALIFGETTMFGHQGLVLRVVIIVLAILTNLTAFQRIWWVYRNTRPDGEPPRKSD